jgi:NAD(P)-dependent dehydrogenase (short-subunit alcohol dehydrogenase family)
MAGPVARLEGRVAIVTGASRGIGLAIAHRLADEGARVCVTARGTDALAAAAAGFQPGRVIFLAGKADDARHRHEVLDAVAETFGRLDILVNNAGINPVYGPLVELEPGAANKITGVNVLAGLSWIQDAFHHSRLGFRERGAVVNISSVTGIVPSPDIGFYGVSKAAVTHLTRALAAELAPAIRVNAVAPAVIRTRFARALYEGREEQVAAGYPLGRLGVPEDVAAAVAFLASDDASWITGQTLVIDGGLLAAGGAA